MFIICVALVKEWLVVRTIDRGATSAKPIEANGRTAPATRCDRFMVRTTRVFECARGVDMESK